MMKLEFNYWNVYFRNLNKHKKIDRSWEEVKKIGKEFESQYKSEIKKIIKIIPKVVGKSWTERIIDVYMVDWDGPSFSHPLTLKVREDLLLMLVILTHELLHHFYTESFPLDMKAGEEKINKDVEKVFDKLGINIEKQLRIIQSFHDKRFGKVLT
jgi:hypothetical protein